MNTLRCVLCGAEYEADATRYACDCGGVMDLAFVPSFDPKAIASRGPDMWRYREAIPVAPGNEISFGEGFTPLLPIDFHGRTVLVKQEQLFPTGSYKDRGASVLISKVRELGATHVVEDSSGNAGASVAAYCAKAGISCDIYVPESTSLGKLAQIRLYGAKLVTTPGNREATARAVLKAAATRFYASHSYSPYFFHGTKTLAFEVAEQLGWRAPDTLVLPVGNGTLLLGAFLGFSELLAAGLVRSLPKIVAVQSARCAPLATAAAQGGQQPALVDSKPTLAEGIAVAEPVRGPQILEAVAQTQGKFLTVTEEEIKKSLLSTCAKGYFIEPTSAAAVAGIQRYIETASRDETIVSVFTGHGLKAPDKLMSLASKA